ncbi:MAG TPA: 30S ribosomal protein S8 [Vitreimonas sp.]|uniref:30S ribosomal protein S8 n=1 Tax=Vitreimonas sp. TaxID=3069702 RepID=UPI002D51BED0|nr:30S ribosomal protein S8 [Vitreimonas sp.]HYD88327.1 30S ribosomal protein S8 [Vitreimonas sp.]
MNINDPVGDLITRIRNAQLRGRSKLTSPASTLRMRVLQVLKDEGYIRDFRAIENGAHKEIEIELKYFEGAPAIHEIQRVSKPGRRVYSSIKDLRLVRNGLGISIISTPKGVMSDAAARDQNVGGEILCEVY